MGRGGGYSRRGRHHPYYCARQFHCGRGGEEDPGAARMTAQLQPAVIGSTGYSGFEVTRLLLHHPHAKKPVLLSRESGGAAGDLTDAYPHLSGNGFGSLAIEPLAWDKLKGVDVVFLCPPPEFSRECVRGAIARCIRIGDLSGAWRLKHEIYLLGSGLYAAQPD